MITKLFKAAFWLGVVIYNLPRKSSAFQSVQLIVKDWSG